MLRRAATFLFSIMAAAVGVAALIDVRVNGQLTLIDPALLGGIALLGTGFLLNSLVSMRDRASVLEGRTDRLTAHAGELESTVAALEAANVRLNASEARYKGLVDSQGDAILRRTSDGRVTYANEAFFKLFGLTPADAIGQFIVAQPHPDSASVPFGSLAERVSGTERISYDQHVLTVAGYRWIAWEDYAIRDAENHLIEIQSVGRDITERKNLEAALMVARDKAQDANRAKSHFLATMSHEIRTPMNGVLGMARLLQDTPLTPDQKTYAEAISQSGLSLLSLIEDILDFSKIESGALVLEKSEVILRPLVEGLTELLATRAQSKNIEIVTAISADVPDIVRADGTRLRQVLTNLIGNAIKFTEEGGVLVSVDIDQGSDRPLHITVRDTGIGVPSEKQVQIFEDFVQADSSHARRFEGTGLGLAISKRLVEAMGGEIGVATAEERGSRFWVRLPLEIAKQDKTRSGPLPLAGKQVGLISGSPMLRTGLALQLAAAGADVTGADRLKDFSSPRPCDLLLLDVTEEEGQALPDLRSSKIPVLALLSPPQRARLTQLADSGISGYLMKPVRQESLERRLAAALLGESDMRARNASPATQHPAVKGLCILLAEDNPVNALLARELLRRRGHRVQEVTTGKDAVTACAAQGFDLVVMDIHMPGLDGIEATRRIRAAEAAENRPRVAILALTADALETGRKACLEAGMDGFLTKPVDPAELDALLATLIPPAIVAAE